MEGPLLPLRRLFSLPMLHVLFKYDSVIERKLYWNTLVAVTQSVQDGGLA